MSHNTHLCDFFKEAFNTKVFKQKQKEQMGCVKLIIWRVADLSGSLEFLARDPYPCV